MNMANVVSCPKKLTATATVNVKDSSQIWSLANGHSHIDKSVC